MTHRFLEFQFKCRCRESFLRRVGITRRQLFCNWIEVRQQVPPRGPVGRLLWKGQISCRSDERSFVIVYLWTTQSNRKMMSLLDKKDPDGIFCRRALHFEIRESAPIIFVLCSSDWAKQTTRLVNPQFRIGPLQFHSLDEVIHFSLDSVDPKVSFNKLQFL